MLEAAKNCSRSPAGRRTLALLVLALLLLALALAPPAPGSAVVSASGWVRQDSETPASLRAVAFPDAIHGWVVGNYGAVFATSTGGKPPVTLRLSGLTGGVLALGGRLAASGTVRPTGPAGSTIALTV